MRPLFIVMGKESLSNLDNIKTAFNQRSLAVKFTLEYKNNIYTIEIDAHMSMIDGKMRSLLSGLGGAHCLLCHITSNTACGRDGDYTSHFSIIRSAANTKEVWSSLVGERQCIKKKKK